MQPRDRSVRPVLIQAAVFAVMLHAVDPEGRVVAWLAAQDLSLLVTAAAPSVPALLGALIGGAITGVVTYVTARQNRQGMLDLDRQKARRERHAARVAPFLEVIDRRLLEYAQVIAAVKTRHVDDFAENVVQAVSGNPFAKALPHFW